MVRLALIPSRRGNDAERGVEAALARRLSEGGFAVELLAQRSAQREVETRVRDGVVVRRFPAPGGAYGSRPSPDLVAHLAGASTMYDVVHAHGLDSAAAAAAVDPRRLVASPGQAGVDVDSRWRLRRSNLDRVFSTFHPDARRALIRASRVVCGSRTEAAQLTARLGVPHGRVVVVPHPIDVGALGAADRFPGAADTVLVISPLERRRGLHRIVAGLVALDESFELIFAGSGPARRSLQNLAVDLGVGDRVRFIPGLSNNDRHRWLRTAAVLVAPAQRAVDRTILEAACAGTPVVAVDVAANREAAARLPEGAVRLVSAQISPIRLADAMHDAIAATPAAEPPSVPTLGEVAQAMARVYRAVLTNDGGPGARSNRAHPPAATGRRPASPGNRRRGALG